MCFSIEISPLCSLSPNKPRILSPGILFAKKQLPKTLAHNMHMYIAYT